jgi:hypothetical protein
MARREIMEIVNMGQTAQGFKMENDMSYAFIAMQQCKLNLLQQQKRKYLLFRKAIRPAYFSYLGN